MNHTIINGLTTILGWTNFVIFAKINYYSFAFYSGNTLSGKLRMWLIKLNLAMIKEKQYFSRKDVLAQVNPNPVWLGDFDKFKYEKIETNLEYCLHTLHTCWNLPGGRHTFINLAKKMKASLIELDDYSKQRIAYFTGNYHEDIIYVSAFRHKDIKTVRAHEYKDSTLLDNVYIAEDHNHRFTSYALKQVNNAEFRNVPVVLYLGKILD